MIRRVFLERMYQNALKNRYNYGHKHLKSGITDITTPDKHIEVKKWAQWKHGLGQLLAYDYCDPKEKLEVHLFGEYPDDKKNLACEIFDRYNIIVVDLETTD